MAILRNAHLLRQFLAVVDQGSLTAAAQKVAVTQSALTKSMHKLEQQLGTPLFERLPRGIALTVYGKTLLPHAQRIVSECRLADLELQALGMGHTGLLKVGAGLMFGATLVPSAISRLYEQFPGVAFQIVSGVTELNFPLLRMGELDLMFGLLPPLETIPPYLDHRPIMELNSRVVAGANHALVGRGEVGAHDLAGYPWAVIQHDREQVNNILAAFSSSGARRPTINVEVTSLSSLVRLLRAGTYLSCFAEPVAAMPDLGLALVPYGPRILRGQAGVVFHRSLEGYGPATALMEMVQTAATQLQL
ncbi:MAG: LysR family transcriptional regulator [Betaproteobacteria bacterium]